LIVAVEPLEGLFCGSELPPPQDVRKMRVVSRMGAQKPAALLIPG